MNSDDDKSGRPSTSIRGGSVVSHEIFGNSKTALDILNIIRDMGMLPTHAGMKPPHPEVTNRIRLALIERLNLAASLQDVGATDIGAIQHTDPDARITQERIADLHEIGQAAAQTGSSFDLVERLERGEHTLSHKTAAGGHGLLGFKDQCEDLMAYFENIGNSAADAREMLRSELDAIDTGIAQYRGELNTAAEAAKRHHDGDGKGGETGKKGNKRG